MAGNENETVEGDMVDKRSAVGEHSVVVSRRKSLKIVGLLGRDNDGTALKSGGQTGRVATCSCL